MLYLCIRKTIVFIIYRQSLYYAVVIFRKARRKLNYAQVGFECTYVQICVCECDGVQLTFECTYGQIRVCECDGVQLIFECTYGQICVCECDGVQLIFECTYDQICVCECDGVHLIFELPTEWNLNDPS